MSWYQVFFVDPLVGVSIGLGVMLLLIGTKTEAARIARQARRYGYYAHLGGIEVNCPRCRQHVRTVLGYHYRPARKGEGFTLDEHGKRVVFERDTVTRALDRAMIDHLMTGECDDSPASTAEPRPPLKAWRPPQR